MHSSGRQLRSRRFALAGAAVASSIIVACESSSSFQPNELFWGFVTISAVDDGSGEPRTAPNAIFFKGEVASIPNASLKPDSCFPERTYVPPVNQFGNVDYLDAGAELSTRIGTTTHAIPRQFASGVTSYKFPNAATLPYVGGDSVVVNVTGASGGFPANELRGKTAEQFVMQQPVIENQKPLQLRWTPATDDNSAMIINLLFARPGETVITREIICAFRDDGVDSIPFAMHQIWASDANPKREVVATRLRTVLRGGGNLAMLFISTFAQPLTKQ